MEIQEIIDNKTTHLDPPIKVCSPASTSSSIGETSNFEHRNHFVPQKKGNNSIQMAKKSMKGSGKQEKSSECRK